MTHLKHYTRWRSRFHVKEWGGSSNKVGDSDRTKEEEGKRRERERRFSIGIKYLKFCLAWTASAIAETPIFWCWVLQKFADEFLYCTLLETRGTQNFQMYRKLQVKSLQLPWSEIAINHWRPTKHWKIRHNFHNNADCQLKAGRACWLCI